jgi:hypothetical protein
MEGFDGEQTVECLGVVGAKTVYLRQQSAPLVLGVGDLACEVACLRLGGLLVLDSSREQCTSGRHPATVECDACPGFLNGTFYLGDTVADPADLEAAFRYVALERRPVDVPCDERVYTPLKVIDAALRVGNHGLNVDESEG